MKYITAYIRCEDCPSRICLHGQNCPYESTKNNYSVGSNEFSEKDNDLYDNDLNTLDEDWCYEICKNDIWTEHY